MKSWPASTIFVCMALFITQVLRPSAPAFAIDRLPASATAASQALLYVADFSGQAVDIYAAGVRNPTVLGKLRGGSAFYPAGVCVGHRGVVYVENDNGIVNEFERGQTTPFRTLAFPSGYFTLGYIAVSNDGSIFVLSANAENADRAILQLSPTGKLVRAIAYPNLLSPGTFATDRAGDLFVSLNEDVFVYAPGATQPMADLKQSAYSAGLFVDRQGQLLVGQPGADRVLVESLPSGAVLRTISTVGAGDYLALDEAVHYLYAVDATGGTLQWYGYGGGRPLGFFPNRSQEVAVDPGSAYFQ